MATLARGGRLNVFGFVLRLAARLPFLFIAGQWYGAGQLGRFAYAVLTVEFAAQIAALGLRRGLAQLLADAKKPQACVVADAMLVAAIGSALCMAILFAFPIAMYPDVRTPPLGMDRYLAVTVLAIAWTDIALAALAYRHDVGATVRARAVVEPWVISIVAFIWSYISLRDGLIVSYVFSMVAALIAALIPL
ncbi:MAG: lipopolysaccharide biosynthesis protein, partial [Sphingomicrobium sp.]